MSNQGEQAERNRGAAGREQDARGSDALRSDMVPWSGPATTPARYGGGSPLQPQRSREGTLTHILETLLDKGLVINADITVSLAGVELLGIRVRAALASFDTAARYGLDFPSGTDRSTVAWTEASELKDSCPNCGKTSPVEQLLNDFCPWCGWRSALALNSADGARGPQAVEGDAGAPQRRASATDDGGGDDTGTPAGKRAGR